MTRTGHFLFSTLLIDACHNTTYAAVWALETNCRLSFIVLCFTPLLQLVLGGTHCDFNLQYSRYMPSEHERKCLSYPNHLHKNGYKNFINILAYMV